MYKGNSWGVIFSVKALLADFPHVERWGESYNAHFRAPGHFFSVIFKDDPQCVNITHNWGLITFLKWACCIFKEVLNEHLSSNALEYAAVDFQIVLYPEDCADLVTA